MVDQGYSRTCPDGTEARDTHGKNCTEMFCADDENCQQVNDFFAKCCKNTKGPENKKKERPEEK
ncbi:hypothetical protein AAVH_29329, partial [Aphelenchoides avenae]